MLSVTVRYLHGHHNTEGERLSWQFASHLLVVAGRMLEYPFPGTVYIQGVSIERYR